MKNQKQLSFLRNIFVFFVVIIFTIIIINEKGGEIFLPKVQKKFNNYLKTNYSTINNSLKMNNITYKNTYYKAKIVSKENTNLYFYLYYSNHQIKDTYQKDYVEGNSLLSHIKTNLQNSIKEKTNIDCNINISTTLNNYTDQVREKIIKEDDLLELKFYSIEKEITIDNWNYQTITKELVTLISTFQKNKITPKSYNITITSKQDITNSIKIENLTEQFTTNIQNEQIINDILNDNNSTIIKQNKITYKYLN